MTTDTKPNFSVDESYEWCRSISRQRAGNFYFSFLTLPRDRFRDMCVLYAFMRICDDLGDDESVPVARRIEKLHDWREQLQSALSSEYFAHPVFPAMAEIVERHRIPHNYLFDVITGIESDLTPRGFETFSELSEYCYHVAGAVGLCCIHIWGFHDPRAIDSAIDCGVAFQLTNILRDVGEDITAGRVYLPGEDLRQFGYTSEDILAHRCDERFTKLMRFEIARAREYYSRAEQLFDYLEPPGKAIYRAMLGIYGKLLSEIECRDYDVYSRRVRLPRWRKLSYAVIAMVRHHWLRG